MGISANPEKVEKVKIWPVPKNIKEVQYILRLASYYRQFILPFARKAQCLHELVGPIANKTKKKARTKGNEIAPQAPELKPFEWMTKHQEAFDALKEALSTAPILGYPYISREFILEADASLNGLGTVLSQQGMDRKIFVIAYASHSLYPSERSMFNYSSAKLKLLALKWAVMEKFQDYLLGPWFQVYMDNNLLAYVQYSKLGASQIRWISDLALFNFTIKYQTGHSNKATDALSPCPFNPSCDFKSETCSNEVEVICYLLVCEAIDQCCNSYKIHEDLKQKAQDISCAVQSIVEEENKEEIVSMLNAVSIIGKVIPEENEGGAAEKSDTNTGL